MWDYSADEVVWYHLGPSYGWWPCQVQDSRQPATISPSILTHLGTHFSHNLRSQNENFIHIKFFDDDSKEWVRVTDFKRVKKYSCKDKKKLIRKGMRTLAESRSSLGLGVNLQLAQFYKDVELAEVMTDNDQEVGDILAQYEVTEEQQEVEDVEDRRQKSDKRKEKEKEKDVLREVKNGRVGKTRGKTKKSTRKL